MSLVDRVAGLLAIMGGVLLLFTGWQLDIGNSKLPGPGFFPVLIALAMGALGVRLFLHPGAEESSPVSGVSRWGSLAIALFSVVIYALVLSEVGFLISTFVLLAVQLRWVEKQTWRTSLITAFMASAISLLLFRVVLKVPLPVGVLPLPTGW